MKKKIDVNRTDSASRHIVEFLLSLGIWVPVEAMPVNRTGGPLVSYKRKSNSFKKASLKNFWIPIGQKKNGQEVVSQVWTNDADHNRNIVIELIKNLNFWSLPITVGSPENLRPDHNCIVDGIGFNTSYYRANKELCWSFYDSLQKKKLTVEGIKSWHMARVTIAPGINNFKILVIHNYNWRKEADLV